MNPLAHSHNWLIFSLIDPALSKSFKDYARGAMLDIGCGVKPYASAAAPYVTRHVGLDRPPSRSAQSRADLIASAYAVPFQDERFDTILCTDVLEHLEEPLKALHEAFRILTRGGHAIATVPLYWHLHEEPRDFYRYTKHGLRYLFERTGFEIIEIRPLTGFMANYSQSVAYFLHSKSRGPWWNPLRLTMSVASALIQLFGYVASRIDRSYEFTMEYLIIAKRPFPRQVI